MGSSINYLQDWAPWDGKGYCKRWKSCHSCSRSHSCDHHSHKNFNWKFAALTLKAKTASWQLFRRLSSSIKILNLSFLTLVFEHIKYFTMIACGVKGTYIVFLKFEDITYNPQQVKILPLPFVATFTNVSALVIVMLQFLTFNHSTKK